MAHLRKQIRDRFATVLAAGLPSNYDVYTMRSYALNHDTTRAVIDIKCLNDQVRQREVMSDVRVRVASFYIRVQRGETEETLDDTLDADEVLITDLIEAEDWSDLLEEDPELLQVNFSDDSTGEYVIGSMIMRYDCEYHIDKADPETRVD